MIEVLSGEAVAGVAVAYRLEGSRALLWLAETDAEGRFVLSDVPAGAVEVCTSRPGYVDGAYGQRRPLGAGQVIELAGGSEVTGLDVLGTLIAMAERVAVMSTGNAPVEITVR